ncbi:hypothetical protein OPQ81_004819 [Rhizoctonia solani]|nr:hypothetical protein OPQ81_004819 [Rhizoctonia solani]
MMQRGNHVRFVLVSATAPNIEDLKDWLSSCSSGEPTSMFKHDASCLVTLRFLRPEFANLGLGVHHAGLDLDERHTVEELFTQRKLSVIVATSTLAVGVNFPAHIVIIKGVNQWTGAGWAEYSSQDIMQMLGRAGRPQFDREGIAVIMCDKKLESKYKLLATGGSQLESTLHCNLTEHINSEIGLGTINSVDSAREWLRKTLLFWRIQKNPAHYKLDLLETTSWEECVDTLVTKSISALKETQLVKHTENGSTLCLTQFGEIMSMRSFIEFAQDSSFACLRSVLTVVCGAEEFKDLHMRGGERQAILGGVPLMSSEYRSPNSQPHMEALNVMRHAPRMITALVDTALVTKNGSVMINGMSLMRSLNGKAWEDRPGVLKQLDGIGEKSYKVLAENGITTIKSLSAQNPNRIEMVKLLNRRPPFGSDIISSARTLPAYSVLVEELSSTANKVAKTVEVELLVTVSVKCASLKDNHAPKGFDARVTSILTITSDNQFIDFRRISTKRLLESVNFIITAPLTKPSQEVVVTVSSDKLAGITERYDFKPTLLAITYPTPNTRPPKPSDIEDARSDILDLTNSDIPEESATNLTKSTKGKLGAATGRGITQGTTKARLPNGNYLCHHKCKDKTACRHICCREGLPKPPPSPKSAKPKSTTGVLLSSPEGPQQKPKTMVEKQKSNLEYLHNKANDGVSRVKRDPLARARDTQPSAKETARYMESLLSSPFRSSTSRLGAKSPDSDQDLPEPSLIRVKKQTSPKSGSTNYDDSDMDQWALNVPSEILELDVETPALSSREEPNENGSSGVVSSVIKSKRPMARGSELVQHRPKRPRVELPFMDESPLIQDTPPRKRPAIKILPTPHTPSSESIRQPKPLFRPSSSVGPPSPGAFNTTEIKPKTPAREDAFEDFMDYIFEGVKIITEDTSEYTSTVIKLQNTPERNLVKQSPLEREYTSQGSPTKEVQQLTHVTRVECERPNSNGDDPMAEFNIWLDENGL